MYLLICACINCANNIHLLPSNLCHLIVETFSIIKNPSCPLGHQNPYDNDFKKFLVLPICIGHGMSPTPNSKICKISPPRFPLMLIQSVELGKFFTIPTEGLGKIASTLLLLYNSNTSEYIPSPLPLGLGKIPSSFLLPLILKYASTPFSF